MLSLLVLGDAAGVLHVEELEGVQEHLFWVSACRRE